MSDRCSAQVWSSTGWPHSHQCHNNAVVIRDGKYYCRIHDPVAVKAKREKRQAEWAAANKRRTEQWKLERAAPALLAALKEAQTEIIRLEALVALDQRTFDFHNVRAAIALAKDGK